MGSGVLLTGASGFIGSALKHQLLANGISVCSLGRSSMDGPGTFIKGELNDQPLLKTALKGVDCVVHLAGRAHQLQDEAADPLANFRIVNRDLTLTLANQAVQANVKRFVFISSIGVNGASTSIGPFKENSPSDPHAFYAISKLEAEQALWELVRKADMELVIIRPPLVYAGHAPGNFARLLKLVQSGIPLPLGSVRNQRSMIALENLIDLIIRCMDHPSAANQLFLASDGEDVSIGEIIKLLASGMGVKARLFPFPDVLMRYGANVLKRESLYVQLCKSLTIDSSKSRSLLSWSPVIDTKTALFNAGRDFSRIASRN